MALNPSGPDPSASQSVRIERLSERPDPSAALDEYHRVDASAFGLPPDPAQIDSKRPLVEYDRWYLASIDGVSCGGAGSFPVDLTLPGGATLPVAAVSDVGVAPTHRRRGVLSALMARQLRDLQLRGESMAVLHASEGSIYRRFGYGPATRWRLVHLDARRAAFRDEWPDPGGSVEIVDKTSAHEVCAAVHDRSRRSRPGGLSRNDEWWSVVLGDVESYIGGNRRQLVMVHRDDAGAADGYAVYDVTEDWSSGQAKHTLGVWELVGETLPVELALWRTLLGHDLVDTVAGTIAVDHPLFDVLVDGRQARTRFDQDRLWARVLDVERVLGARSYATSGSLVLEVADGTLDDVGGRFRIDAGPDGSATCRRSSDPAELGLDISDLGACALGGGSFRRLARAGRLIEHADGAASRADQLMSVDPLPWCWVRF